MYLEGILNLYLKVYHFSLNCFLLPNQLIIINFQTFSIYRARGYPEPIVTWRREDGSEIVLKDSAGTKTLGKLMLYKEKNFKIITILYYFKNFLSSVLFSGRSLKTNKNFPQ